MDKPKKRMVVFDLLRGFFLFVIIIDHLGRFPGIYELFTGKNLLWTSAAEGFFFISGIMTGYVRGRKSQAKPFREVLGKTLPRGLMLYGITVLFTILFTFLAYHAPVNADLKPGWATINSISDIGPFLFNTFTFQYVYSWADFLQYYSVYIIVSPLVIWLLRKNKWWVVLPISIATWFLFHDQSFYLGWQLLFFSGMVTGYYLPEIKEFIGQVPTNYRQAGKAIILLLAIITLGLSITSALGLGVYNGTSFGHVANIVQTWVQSIFNVNGGPNPALFDKDRLPLARLGIFYLWFTALLILFSKFEDVIMKTVGKLFIVFGTNSLFVYLLHGFVVYFVDMYIVKTGSFWPNVVITTCALVFIWGVTKYKSELLQIFVRLYNFIPLPAVQFTWQS